VSNSKFVKTTGNRKCRHDPARTLRHSRAARSSAFVWAVFRVFQTAVELMTAMLPTSRVKPAFDRRAARASRQFVQTTTADCESELWAHAVRPQEAKLTISRRTKTAFRDVAPEDRISPVMLKTGLPFEDETACSLGHNSAPVRRSSRSNVKKAPFFRDAIHGSVTGCNLGIGVMITSRWICQMVSAPASSSGYAAEPCLLSPRRCASRSVAPIRYRPYRPLSIANHSSTSCGQSSTCWTIFRASYSFLASPEPGRATAHTVQC